MTDTQRDGPGGKRSRSRSPPPWRRPHKIQRQHVGGTHQTSPLRNAGSDSASIDLRAQERAIKERSRLNQIQEAEQMREWVSQEDTFVLRQAKRKAEIRIKEGRAKPIDWLTVMLRVIDPTRNPLDDEIEDSEIDLVDPQGVFEGLSSTQFQDLEKDIDTYISLETNSKNMDFWKTMKVICRDRSQTSSATGPEGRAVNPVAADINRLFSPKSYEQLEALEGQITQKLQSNEPIDVDYWEQLLRSLTVWKAKAKLKKVYQSVIEGRLQELRNHQREEAIIMQKKLAPLVSDMRSVMNIGDPQSLDPEPLLHLKSEDKSYEMMDEEAFLGRVKSERRKISKMGFVPTRQRMAEKAPISLSQRAADAASPVSSRFSTMPNDDFSQATKALYEKEMARGIGENEEIFAGEESVDTKSKSLWADKHRPRKPRYFNRVQMGYEWNKYNQTHYDHDNPPPKVVQGYKFNIFYPDLIDKAKAPTYKIERENGRKRGQSFAPAGEEDTCLIRFMSGPPYEDLAFRIVDKEWDYSAKRERGFKSSFDKVCCTDGRCLGHHCASRISSGVDLDRYREFYNSIFNSRRYTTESNPSTVTTASHRKASHDTNAIGSANEFFVLTFIGNGHWV